MAGKDLLDQRGARARHAHDEYRHGRWIARPALVPYQFGGEHGPDAFEPVQRLCFIIGDLPSLARIALEQMMERSGLIAQISEDLTKRKMQPDLLLHL